MNEGADERECRHTWVYAQQQQGEQQQWERQREMTAAQISSVGLK
jgi:hypothetical protein